MSRLKGKADLIITISGGSSVDKKEMAEKIARMLKADYAFNVFVDPVYEYDAWDGFCSEELVYIDIEEERLSKKED